MATDIRLDDGSTGNWITVDAPVLKVSGSDFILDSQVRRGTARTGHRRALVHADGDCLTLNFNGDYTGGVSIRNARINVACLHQSGGAELPKNGTIGDLLVTHNRVMMDGHEIGVTATLWLCIGKHERLVSPSGAHWVPISHGEAIEGTT